MWLEPNLILQLQQKGLLCNQLHQVSKKLVSDSTISMPVTEASKKDVVVLDSIAYICYPIYFRKTEVQV